MPKTKKRFLILGIMLAITLVVFCFLFVFDIDRKSVGESNAEISNNKVQEETQDTTVTTETIVSNGRTVSGRAGAQQKYGKVWIQYDDTYISSVSVNNLSVRNLGRTGYVQWNTPSFVLNPQSGLEWNSSSYSITLNTSSASNTNSGYNNPTTYTGYSTSTVTFSRSTNTFSNGTQLQQSGRYVLWYIDLSSYKMFTNSWSVQPAIASWVYGETEANPVGSATYSGSITYTYYDSNQNQLSSKPTTPGSYYMRCYDSGGSMVDSITSGMIAFNIYAPNPTMTTTSFQWTGSSIDASANNNCSYNSTYVNAPSGVTGTNIQGYTAEFTTKSGYIFSNGTNTYTISWSITKRTLTIPTVSGSFTYDNTSKNATISNMNATYITQGGTASATNANTYTVTFTLKNTSGCQWSDGTTGQKSGTWVINRNPCAIKPTLKDSGSYTYTGSAININTHVNNFNTSYMTVSNNSQTNAGNYTTTYTLNSNYAWTDGTTANATVSWSITPKPLTKPTLSVSPTYNGSSVSPTLSNFDSNTMNKTGDTSATNVNTSGNYSITISLKDTTNYKWSDNTIASYTISWNVLPKDISGGTITITPTDYTYDGAEHKPTVTVTVP